MESIGQLDDPAPRVCAVPEASGAAPKLDAHAGASLSVMPDMMFVMSLRCSDRVGERCARIDVSTRTGDKWRVWAGRTHSRTFSHLNVTRCVGSLRCGSGLKFTKVVFLPDGWRHDRWRRVLHIAIVHSGHDTAVTSVVLPVVIVVVRERLVPLLLHLRVREVRNCWMARGGDGLEVVGLETGERQVREGRVQILPSPSRHGCRGVGGKRPPPC